MHISDSGDDPDIDGSIILFGSDGYYVFFRTLEIMSREFDIHHPGQNTFMMEFFLKKFRTSRRKTLVILEFFQEKGRIFTLITKSKGIEYISLNCPKLKDLCDEYTSKLLKKIGTDSRPESGVTPTGEGEVEGYKDPKDTLKEEPWPFSSEQLHEASDLLIEQWLDALSEYLGKDIFPEAVKFKTSMLSNGNKYNSRAVLHALNQLLKKKKRSSKPWPYCLKILTVENGNYNERDAAKSHR